MEVKLAWKPFFICHLLFNIFFLQVIVAEAQDEYVGNWQNSAEIYKLVSDFSSKNSGYICLVNGF